MTRDELISLAEDVGFERVDILAGLARRSVLLQPGSVVTAHAPTSRLGGLPELPRGVDWPRHGGRRLAFIGQVRLEEMPRFIGEEGFPQAGLLSFFYDAEQQPWGYDPAHAGSSAVLFTPDARSVVPVSAWPEDIPEGVRYRSCQLVPEEAITLPDFDSLLIEELGLSDAEVESYGDIFESLASAPGTLLGGHPDQMQGDMLLECELVSAGLSCTEEATYEDERLPLFKKQAASWRQLLQVNSCEQAGMQWGDAGCLYYWIREAQLLSRRFDATWLILQSS